MYCWENRSHEIGVTMRNYIQSPIDVQIAQEVDEDLIWFVRQVMAIRQHEFMVGGCVFLPLKRLIKEEVESESGKHEEQNT